MGRHHPHRLTRPVLALLGAAAALALSGCTSGGPATPNPSSSGSVTTTPTSAPGTATATGGSSSPTTSGSPRNHAVHQRLTDVHVADLTFVGDQAWLLGTATCLNGSGGGCTAIEHSTDEGRTWTSMPSPAGVHVVVPSPDSSGACTSNCLTGIRFVSLSTGYLFGGGSDGALFQTGDGGQHWVRVTGSAPALEGGGGVILRVEESAGCPPGCTYSVRMSETDRLDAGVRTIALPGRANEGAGLEFGLSGRHAYLLSLGHVAGGGNTATSVLWTSSDGGSTWANRGEPCPQRGGEYDSSELSVGPDGSAGVLCRQRTGQHQFVATTTAASGGAHFVAAPTTSLGSAEVTALGVVSASTVILSSDETYRSADGGAHLARLSGNGGSSPGQLSWIAFSSASVGHAISLDRTTLWLTTDGGRTWAATTPH